ncbi:MAG: dehydrogenase [Thalassobius sp.]|nr:dehydrogenase [Thalassovita sp.]
MKKTTSQSRRKFLQKTTLAASAISMGIPALSAKSYNRILGANDRVTIAQIGCKRRANAMKGSYKKLTDNINFKYVCDVYVPQMDSFGEEVKNITGTAPTKEGDVRKVLEDKEIDAIINTTPDHWHTPLTCMALETGKHVYVEKPCSHNPWEGEQIVAFQKKFGKVVQMGNQQRSALESQEIIKEIHNGIIGDVYLAKAFYTNTRTSIGNAKETAVPEGFNWDLFQGPAPRQSYKDIFFDYNWHWFWEFGTAETGNNAIHEIDVARWALGVSYPEEVSVVAGKYHFKDDDWTMYDTMLATYKFGGDKTIVWDGKSRNGMDTYGSDRGTIIYGSEGSVYVDRNGYRLYDRDGKMTKEALASARSSTTALGGGGNATDLHMKNFFETVVGKAKSNSPINEGAVSTLLAHLANISSRANQTLKCNPENGNLLDKKLMREYWKREYEPGWEPAV